MYTWGYCARRHVYWLQFLISADARAIEANIEESYVKIIALQDPPPDPDTYDGDENGIVDRAQLRLLDVVLRENDAPNHILILGLWTVNFLQIQQDNPLGNQCAILPILFDITCDNINRAGAGAITTGDPATIETLLGLFK